jgi:hypothetical protein
MISATRSLHATDRHMEIGMFITILVLGPTLDNSAVQALTE